MGLLGTAGTVVAVFAFLGAAASVVLGNGQSWIWLVGVVAGIVMVLLATVYNLKFIVWPGLMLLAFAGGAAVLSWVSGKWKL